MLKFICPGIARKLDYLATALTHMENRIMTAISDFAAKQTAFNTEIASDLATLKTNIDNLNAQIAALQNSSGTVTPSDQALIDGLVTSGQALSDQADALAGKTAAAPMPPTS